MFFAYFAVRRRWNGAPKQIGRVPALLSPVRRHLTPPLQQVFLIVASAKFLPRLIHVQTIIQPCYVICVYIMIIRTYYTCTCAQTSCNCKSPTTNAKQRQHSTLEFVGSGLWRFFCSFCLSSERERAYVICVSNTQISRVSSTSAVYSLYAMGLCTYNSYRKYSSFGVCGQVHNICELRIWSNRIDQDTILYASIQPRAAFYLWI